MSLKELYLVLFLGKNIFLKNGNIKGVSRGIKGE